MKKLAFVFAGQGSQYPQMGLDFLEDNLDLNTLSKKADHILGYPSKEVLTGLDCRLNQTKYTQPMILLSSIYAYEYLKTLDIKPEGMLGFSLGEYTALYASGVFSFEETIELVNNRAEFMHQSTQEHQGSMAAILGLPSKDVVDLLNRLNGSVYPANFNSPIQTVISGTDDMIDIAIIKAKELGCKRAIKLNVSGAFHSPLMLSASTQFEEYIKPFNPKNPSCQVILNTTAKPLLIHELKEEMVKQIISPVRFVEAITYMINEKFTHFIEIGPGTVLSGLIKKIDEHLEVTHISHKNDLDQVKGWLIHHGFIK